MKNQQVNIITDTISISSVLTIWVGLVPFSEKEVIMDYRKIVVPVNLNFWKFSNVLLFMKFLDDSIDFVFALCREKIVVANLSEDFAPFFHTHPFKRGKFRGTKLAP